MCWKLLFRLLPILLVTFASASRKDDAGKSNCTTFVTVRDFTGLDGCGIVFEMEDGEILEPQLDPSLPDIKLNDQFTYPISPL